MIMKGYAIVGEMRIGKANRSNLRKSIPVSLFIPKIKIPKELIWKRTRVKENTDIPNRSRQSQTAE
jgi:hypothetical protein